MARQARERSRTPPGPLWQVRLMASSSSTRPRSRPPSALARRRVRGARAWVLVWCGVLVLANGLQLSLALHKVHNSWVGYAVIAASVVVLWALSYWQSGYTAQLTLRISIIGLLVVLAVLTLVSLFSSFSRAEARPSG